MTLKRDCLEALRITFEGIPESDAVSSAIVTALAYLVANTPELPAEPTAETVCQCGDPYRVHDPKRGCFGKGYPGTSRSCVCPFFCPDKEKV